MESDEQKQKLNLRYSARTMSLRDLKSLDDWREWQANAMAAGLLMPAKYIEMMLGSRKLTLYGERMNKPDWIQRENMCYKLGVSRAALMIRLKSLGYVIVRPASEYCEPMDIGYDDGYE